MLFALVIGGVVIGTFYHLWSNWELYKLSWKMPGPMMLPLIGNTYSMLGATHEGLLAILTKLTSKFPTPMRFWLGPKLFILVTKPEDTQIIFNAQECLSRDDVYQYLRPFIGDGLVTLPAPSWKDHRKFLNPCFSLKILQSYMPIFNKEVKTLIQRLSEKVDKGSFDMYDHMDACSLDIVCQTTLGTQMNIQKNQNIEYLDAANNLLAIMTTRIFNPIYHMSFLYRFSKWFKEEQKSSDITFGFVDKILQKKKAKYNSEKYVSEKLNEDESVSFKSPQIFIDQLLKLSKEGNYFSDHDVRSEANTIVATGYESTALITSYCILMLAMNPDMQQKAFEEIRSVIPNKGDDVKYDDLAQFEYIERLLKETMRVFPTVPVVARKADADFQLNKYKIPAGTHIAIGVMEMQRDKSIWGPDADKFNPDNFLPENIEKIHPYAYVPFSAGPRNCLGMKYAYMLLKTMLVHLVSNYTFTTDLKFDELKFRVDITLKLSNRHLVHVHPRIN